MQNVSNKITIMSHTKVSVTHIEMCVDTFCEISVLFLRFYDIETVLITRYDYFHYNNIKYTIRCSVLNINLLVI